MASYVYGMTKADVVAAARASDMYRTVNSMFAQCFCLCACFFFYTFLVLDVQPGHAYDATGKTSQCLSTPFIMVECFEGLALRLER